MGKTDGPGTESQSCSDWMLGQVASLARTRPRFWLRDPERTFVEWMRYCATYGHYEDGATLYDKAGFTVDELQQAVIDEDEEETAYDAARGFADLCKRKMKKNSSGEDAESEEEPEEQD